MPGGHFFPAPMVGAAIVAAEVGGTCDDRGRGMYRFTRAADCLCFFRMGRYSARRYLVLSIDGFAGGASGAI